MLSPPQREQRRLRMSALEHGALTSVVALKPRPTGATCEVVGPSRVTSTATMMAAGLIAARSERRQLLLEVVSE
jgi:hypothetical protein